MTVALFMAGTQQVAAQCSGQIELTATLNAEESGEASAAFNVDLQSIDVDLTWTKRRCMAFGCVGVFGAPDGSCLVWGGYDVSQLGIAKTSAQEEVFSMGQPCGLMTGMFLFKVITAQPLMVPDGLLAGTGTWTIEIVNGWATAAAATYEFTFTLNGLCSGDCPDPAACNYVPVEEQTNPLEDACLYAEDLYGVGYGCDGLCLGDSDGDGICDATDTCDGVIDECGECAGTGMLGCTDVTACNATMRPQRATMAVALSWTIVASGGGSGVLGCTDFMACNFDPSATCDSGGCLTFDECGECGARDTWPARTPRHATTIPGRAATTALVCSTTLGVCGGPCAEMPMRTASAIHAPNLRVLARRWRQ